MAKNKTINAKGMEIVIFQSEESDYISLTNLARYKDASHTDTKIRDWLRKRNTVDLLQRLVNPSSDL